MNLLVWISLIFIPFCYSLAPQKNLNMISILQNLESYQSIQSFPQSQIATIQIEELRREHHIYPQQPIFSTDFLTHIKSIIKRCQNDPQSFIPPCPITLRDHTRYTELCHTLIDLVYKLENDPHDDILSFYLKRTLDSLIYIATPYSCYEEVVYQKKFKELILHLRTHPFWKKINPLKSTSPLQVIPKAQNAPLNFILEGEHNPLMIHQRPQLPIPYHKKKYDLLVFSQLHGFVNMKGNQWKTVPFLTYYSNTELSFPFRDTCYTRIAQMHFSHTAIVILKIFRKPPSRRPPATHTPHPL